MVSGRKLLYECVSSYELMALYGAAALRLSRDGREIDKLPTRKYAPVAPANCDCEPVPVNPAKELSQLAIIYVNAPNSKKRAEARDSAAKYIGGLTGREEARAYWYNYFFAGVISLVRQRRMGIFK
jgi:hypothetical protein